MDTEAEVIFAELKELEMKDQLLRLQSLELMKKKNELRHSVNQQLRAKIEQLEEQVKEIDKEILIISQDLLNKKRSIQAQISDLYYKLDY
jgi:hypothetical protein